ncbi:MAG: DUF1501 domain-containing protein [Phycisphaerales bacterium]|nr:DUF1501 domain-containing protein [Phycisphaerales bacterium]
MVPDSIFTTRRDFLSGSLRLLSASATLPLFLGQTASALPQTAPRRGREDSQRVLVVVQLAGGNDGLNTVIPYEHELYYRYRRQLAVPRNDVLALANGVGLHPSAAGLKALYDVGQLAIVQGVGYPNPNRSHFVSMDIWHTADPQQRRTQGWLGRYMDACCAGSDPPAPIQGIALMQEAPLALQGDTFTALAFSNPDELVWRAGRRDPRAQATFDQLNNRTGDIPQDGPQLARYLQRTALDAQLGADQIRSAAGNTRIGRAPRGPGGNPLSAQLALVARMIQADLPTRIYYVSLGGFDTHTGQAGRHRTLLQQLGDGLQDFLDTLAEAKLLDRVLVLSFSEFGRRVQENASGGTDHGAAAPVFLCGSKVRPGLHEPHPDLAKLDRGDLAFGVDFRRVYATILRDWLGLPPRDLSKVIGTGYAPLRLLKA